MNRRSELRRHLAYLREMPFFADLAASPNQDALKVMAIAHLVAGRNMFSKGDVLSAEKGARGLAELQAAGFIKCQYSDSEMRFVPSQPPGWREMDGTSAGMPDDGSRYFRLPARLQ